MGGGDSRLDSRFMNCIPSTLTNPKLDTHQPTTAPTLSSHPECVGLTQCVMPTHLATSVSGRTVVALCVEMRRQQ